MSKQSDGKTGTFKQAGVHFGEAKMRDTDGKDKGSEDGGNRMKEGDGCWDFPVEWVALYTETHASCW